MTPDEFRVLALAHVEGIEEAELESRMKQAMEGANVERFTDLLGKFHHAQAAFPGMMWEEFEAINRRRRAVQKRGRPPRAVDERADEPLWRAARDADLIKQLWRKLQPTSPLPRWPIHPHQIAAERHGVNRQVLDEAIKRPRNRRGDKIAAPK